MDEATFTVPFSTSVSALWAPALRRDDEDFSRGARLPGTMTRMGRCMPDARRKQPLAPWRIPMEMILLIVVIVLLFGGGGYWGRRRGHW